MPISNQAAEISPQAGFQAKKNPKLLLFAFAVILILISIGITGYWLGNRNKNKIITPLANNVFQETISGTFDLNGFIPPDSFLGFEVKKSADSSYTIVGSGLKPGDGLTWQWGEAVKGVEYEVRAFLVRNQNRISQSDSISVVAPAFNEVLRIVSSVVVDNPAKTAISGTIDLNGYIPAASTIILQQRKKGEENFNTFAQINAHDGSSWSLTDADIGTTYDFEAYLSVNGKNTGQSVILTVSAPANNEILVINSTANPPTPVQVSLSGRVGINGPIPAGSTITIGERITGTSQFNMVVSGLSASDGVSWNWSGVSAGVSYDLQAYLLTNGNTTSQSQILTVSAPGQNEVLNININTVPAQPPADSINVWCLAKSSNNLWQVKISYNNNQRIQNALQYHITMGTSQGNQLVDSVISPSDPKQTQTLTSDYVVKEGVSYYAQFAYATCINCNNFSPFSPSSQFICQTGPTAVPTVTSVPVPSATTQPSPVQPTITIEPTSIPIPSEEPAPTN